MGRLKMVAGAIALLAACLGAACTGTTESPASLRITTATPTQEEDAPVAAAPTRTRTPPTTQTAEPTVAETPSPTTTTTAPSGSDLNAAFAAASAALGVPAGEDCVDGQDCIKEMPGGGTRIDGSIAKLAYVSASGGGAMVVMGRDSAGAWKFWMLTQIDHYQLLDVPGRLRACSDTPGLTVRQEASGSAANAGEVSHGEVMQSDSFVLTQAGTLDAPGAGWYRINSPVAGWVQSKDTSDAAHGNCNLRNEVEAPAGSIG